MPKVNARLEAARLAYREALEAARREPSSESWAKLLAAGKELSACEEAGRGGRRGKGARSEPGELVPDIETLE
ncbi:hypothetical protein [Anaeromyxobacter paludicola]|uniref:Uncharacterized protein n=1 Tax=Anaeromyxobacter paludicola TaxID=2918171 RepID=A0ABM7X736_9BACT|nr:hypothetical protein [Anaeromyxobacter paludicola]BDG07650.1 hypothetical protein AMPC_07630 [Anaeromyxobacter paludicola]